MTQITTKEQIEDIMDKFCDFHDSMLIDIQFHPQTSFFENNASVALKFDNSGWWKDDVILKFDELESFIIRPEPTGYPVMWNSYLTIENGYAYFVVNTNKFNGIPKEEDDNTIYVKAKSLYYEFVEHKEDEE